VRVSLVEQLHDAAEHLRLGDERRRRPSRVNGDVDREVEIVARIDNHQEVMRLNRLHEAAHRLLLGVRQPDHLAHRVEQGVAKPDVPVAQRVQVGAEGGTPRVERPDQHLGDEPRIGRVEVVRLAAKNAEQRDIAVLRAHVRARPDQHPLRRLRDRRGCRIAL
jgi:hypothetical protein